MENGDVQVWRRGKSRCGEGMSRCGQGGLKGKGLGLVCGPRTHPEVTLTGDPHFTMVLLEVSSGSAPLGDSQISVETTGAHLGFIPPQNYRPFSEVDDILNTDGS